MGVIAVAKKRDECGGTSGRKGAGLKSLGLGMSAELRA
jgi:hypothetical protein